MWGQPKTKFEMTKTALALMTRLLLESRLNRRRARGRVKDCITRYDFTFHILFP